MALGGGSRGPFGYIVRRGPKPKGGGTQVQGIVYIVGAGPGDPELITVRGARLLRGADVVLYDRLVSPELLETVRADALRIFVGKRCGRASVTQDEINETLVRHAKAGLRVVRLKGGDPFVFGRGAEECLELAREGIPFEVVPGITSATAVPAYAGIPVTHRNLATAFTVISGHLHGESDAYDWRALAASPTLVVLMGLGNLGSIAERLIAAGKPHDTPAAVIQSGTGEDQKVVTAPLSEIARAAAELEPPAVIVVGPAVALSEQIRWFGSEAAVGGSLPTASH
jgi:uroporphyrin-III C-methyltransferase